MFALEKYKTMNNFWLCQTNFSWEKAGSLVSVIFHTLDVNNTKQDGGEGKGDGGEEIQVVTGEKNG